MKRKHPLGDEDEHQALIRSWMTNVPLTVKQPPEPGTATVYTANGTESIALGADPLTQSITLLELPNVLEIDISVNNLDTAADIALAVRSHPETFRTVVRLYHNTGTSGERFPIFEASRSVVFGYEQATEQFLAAFTVDAADEPISMEELAETVSSWYQNLTGDLITLTWIGRALTAVGVRENGQGNTDRAWAEEVYTE